MRVKAISLLCCFISCSAFSAQTFTGVTIKDVIVNMSTGIHFRINESMNYNEACSSTAWIKVESGAEYEKEAFSSLLAYQAQGKPVTLYLKGCSGGYPRLEYIY